MLSRPAVVSRTRAKSVALVRFVWEFTDRHFECHSKDTHSIVFLRIPDWSVEKLPSYNYLFIDSFFVWGYTKLIPMTTMPRVVPDQRSKFENDELFRKLGRDSEIRYTGYRDRAQEERQMRFVNSCREGHAQLSFVATGTNLHLQFYPNSWSETTDRKPTKEYVDFDKEIGKVCLKSQFILNGVCVIWRGYIDLNRLDGVGHVEFDSHRAKEEDEIYRATMEQQNRRLREFEERTMLHRKEFEQQVGREARRRGGHPGTMAQQTATANSSHC